MATAGYNFVVSCSTSEDGTYEEFDATSASFSDSADVLDVTDTTSGGYHQRILGLLDTSIEIEFNWSSSNTALSTVRTAYTGRSELWVKYIPDGNAGNGYKFQCVVESISTSSGVTDVTTGSVSLQGIGAPVADNS